ncbi:FkbM family methyltransferase [Bradyrhizobium sp. dw_78]|uniref:FkbM family methyltransferase n=1 Tax=Bradyrhizobium sp. dw_78 TaxID=2719793 RepID=UPI001BD586A4|nr:FkbM family methyltransferase [Bradyrhizobium sp. dw_78]
MPAVEHIGALRSLDPRTVVDVGANKGQFSLVAQYLFPNAQIHAFEPLEGERRIYQSVISGPVQVHSVALGANKGNADFFVASRADSSSLLAPGKGQQSAYGVGLSSTTTVCVDRLENVIGARDLIAPVLLKLDVQGAELQVLQGAEKLLPQVDAVYCEVSFVELYERQPMASSIVSFLDSHGFVLSGVFNLSVTKQFGPTQADFLFSRARGESAKTLPESLPEFLPETVK